MAVWAVIPAAGTGQRFGGDVPKQYAELAGRPLLAHVLELFLTAPGIAGIVVATAPGDERWRALCSSPPRPIVQTIGGESRAESVLAALAAIEERVGASDWALVHDAARPCLTPRDLAGLLEALAQDPVGGLLAMPVVDTLKRADARGRVGATAERAGLWRALTPQMFRYGLLRSALADALAHGVEITDESMAMERAGHAPRLVAGGAGNIKVTRAEDLALAEAVLRARG